MQSTTENIPVSKSQLWTGRIISTLVALVTFHQAYHAGQTGILRRMAGKEGALA